MSLITTISQLNTFFLETDRKHKTLGFVPTMGYLHEGHLSLIRTARQQNDLVLVSIFVNPTQFAPGEDFESYPRDIKRDFKLATEEGADVVFYPAVDEIYCSDSGTVVEVTGEITQKLCGAARPTHFKGVTTVVNILFNIVRPDRAYFGQKDAQQAVIIKRMVRDLHMQVEIVVCPIVREEDGLALSSRNVYLNAEERKAATVLNRALCKAEFHLKTMDSNCCATEMLREIMIDELQSQPLANVEYVQVLDGNTLEPIPVVLPGKAVLAVMAVKFGNTRLIDNKILSL